MSIYDAFKANEALRGEIFARKKAETALAAAQAQVRELRAALTDVQAFLPAAFGKMLAAIARESGDEALRSLMFEAAQLTSTGMISDEALRDEIESLLKGDR